MNWTKSYVMSDNDDNTTFKITNTKVYVPITTLSTEDNVKPTKQLNEGFKKDLFIKINSRQKWIQEIQIITIH